MNVPDLETRYRVRPGRRRLADHDPTDTAGLDRKRPDRADGRTAAEALRLLLDEG